MKQGAHTYHGQKIGRADRLLSKLGPLGKIRPEVWLSVFPSEPALTAFENQLEATDRASNAGAAAYSRRNFTKPHATAPRASNA